MPIITAIKPQKNKKRVNIYLDGKFAFGLDLENFIKLGLKVEQELSDKEIEDILKKVELQKVSDKILRFATLRPRSEKEFYGWLRRHKVHKSLHKKLFDKLKRLNLLDDEIFAKWWIGQRLQFKSKRELEYELRIKGIDRNIIEDVLAEVDIDEEKLARELLNKKKYRWDKLTKYDAKKKMIEFLGRRRFGWDAIKNAVDDFFQKD